MFDGIARMKLFIIDEGLDETTRTEVLGVHQELEDSIRDKRTTIINALISVIATQVTSLSAVRSVPLVISFCISRGSTKNEPLWWTELCQVAVTSIFSKALTVPHQPSTNLPVHAAKE